MSAKGIVTITTIQARNLPRLDKAGTLDPYFVFKLGGVTKQTEVVRNNPAPVYNQTLSLNYSSGKDEVLVEGYDWDGITKIEFVGSATIKLSNYLNQTKKEWITLIGMEGDAEGDVELEINCTSDDAYAAASPKDGKGTWEDAKKGEKYIGTFVNGEKEGFGIQTLGNGEVYEGTFKKGKRHGKGVCSQPNGDVYNGDWVEGQKQGKGSTIWAIGKQYIGDYVNGLEEGKGIWSAKDGRRYDGDYKAGKQTGKGSYKYPNGTKYVGDMIDGKFQGHGVETTYEGEIYDGEWKSGQKHGKGVLKDKKNKILFQDRKSVV